MRTLILAAAVTASLTTSAIAQVDDTGSTRMTHTGLLRGITNLPDTIHEAHIFGNFVVLEFSNNRLNSYYRALWLGSEEYHTDSTNAIIIGCDNYNTEVYIQYARHLSLDDEEGERFTYQIDERPSQQWSLRGQSHEEGIQFGRIIVPVPFIQNLFGGETLTIRYPTETPNSPAIEFKIEGIEEAATFLSEGCTW